MSSRPDRPSAAERYSRFRAHQEHPMLADFASRGWMRVDSRAVTIIDRDRLARRAR